MPRGEPSLWVRRFAPLIRAGGHVLDVAAGSGRHAAFLRQCGFEVTAVDRQTAALQDLTGEKCRVVALDLEAGPPDTVLEPLGGGFDGIVVTNYLHRPLFPSMIKALAPDALLIYETFAAGNERFGNPRNPDFLLRPGELLSAFAGLTVIAFEQGELHQPVPAVKQRIAAVNGPVGPLPE